MDHHHTLYVTCSSLNEFRSELIDIGKRLEFLAYVKWIELFPGTSYKYHIALANESFMLIEIKRRSGISKSFDVDELFRRMLHLIVTDSNSVYGCQIKGGRVVMENNEERYNDLTRIINTHEIRRVEINRVGGSACEPTTTLTIELGNVLPKRLKTSDIYGAWYYMSKVTPKKVIFNNPATIVLWSDGTKTVVTKQKGDRYNKETGLALCYVKKFCGNNTSRGLNDILKLTNQEDK